MVFVINDTTLFPHVESVKKLKVHRQNRQTADMVAKKNNAPIINEILMAIIIQSPWFMAGVAESYTAFLLPQIQNSASQIDISYEQTSWLGSLCMFVTPIGCFFGGLIMEGYGRRFFLRITHVPFVLSWIITGCATGVPMLYCGRIFAGLAAGLVFCTPTYVSEIVTVDRRGLLLALQEPWYALGVVFSNVVVDLAGWRYSAYTFAGFSSVLFLFSFWPLESPNWLVRKNRVENAVETLTRTGRSSEQARNDVAKLVSYYERQPNTTLRRRFADLIGCRKSFFILLGLLILTLGTASKILIVYTVLFIDQLDLPVDSSFVCIVYSIVRVIGSVFPLISAVYAGRRLSLGISGFGMTLTISLVLAYELLVPAENRTDRSSLFFLPLIGFYAYNLFFCLAAMTLPYTMVGELFPSNVSALGTGIYGSIGFILTGLVLHVYPIFLLRYGMLATLWTMAACSFALVLYSIFVLPETKGKTFGEIQSELEHYDNNSVKPDTKNDRKTTI